MKIQFTKSVEETRAKLSICTLIVTLVAAFGLLASATKTVQASPVVIDPGNVGDTFFFNQFTFDEFDGQALDGSQITFDFLFSDMKYLEVVNTFFDSASFRIRFTTNGQVSDPPTAFANVTGFLSDENGQSILGVSGAGGTTSGNAGVVSLLFNGLTEGLIFHDIHFTFDLPTLPGRQITGAILQIATDDLSFRVGAPTQAVPEPSTLTLILLGLAAFVMRGRLRTAGTPA